MKIEKHKKSIVFRTKSVMLHSLLMNIGSLPFLGWITTQYPKGTYHIGLYFTALQDKGGMKG